jgi:uncharacterized protein
MPNTPQTQYRYSPAEPTLKDVLLTWKKDILVSINCHAVATIQSFNPSDTKFSPARASVTAQINYCKTFFLPTNDGTIPTPTYKQYTPLVNVPIITMAGGSSSLTFPINAGDQCIILFNDRSLDEWEQGSASASQPLNSARIHSISDAIALVGFPTLSNYSTTHATLSNGTTQVGVGSSTVKIANASTTLNTLMQEILTQLQNLSTAVAAITVTGSFGTSSPPVNSAAFVSVSSSLSTLATQLGQLIE